MNPKILSSNGSVIKSTITDREQKGDHIYWTLSTSVGTLGDNRQFTVVDRATENTLGSFTISVVKEMETELFYPHMLKSGYTFEITLITDRKHEDIDFCNQYGDDVKAECVITEDNERIYRVYTINVDDIKSEGLNFKDMDIVEFYFYYKGFPFTGTHILKIKESKDVNVKAPAYVFANEKFTIEAVTPTTAKPIIRNSSNGKIGAAELSVEKNGDGTYTHVMSLSVGTSGIDRIFTVHTPSGEQVGMFNVDIREQKVVSPSRVTKNQAFVISVTRGRYEYVESAVGGSITIKNESGKNITNKIVKQYTTATEAGIAWSSTTYEVELSVGTAGAARTFSVYLYDGTLYDTFTLEVSDTESKVNSAIPSKKEVSRNETFEVTVSGTSDLTRYKFYNEKNGIIGSKLVSKVIKGNEAVCVYSLSIGSSGERMITVKGDNGSGKYNYKNTFEILVK